MQIAVICLNSASWYHEWLKRLVQEQRGWELCFQQQELHFLCFVIEVCCLHLQWASCTERKYCCWVLWEKRVPCLFPKWLLKHATEVWQRVRLGVKRFHWKKKKKRYQLKGKHIWQMWKKIISPAFLHRILHVYCGFTTKRCKTKVFNKSTYVKEFFTIHFCPFTLFWLLSSPLSVCLNTE